VKVISVLNKMYNNISPAYSNSRFLKLNFLIKKSYFIKSKQNPQIKPKPI